MSLEALFRTPPAPVRRLDELPELERRLVCAVRLWRDGPDGRAELAAALAARAGPAVGRAAAARLGELMALTQGNRRLPLRVARVGAPGALGDECVLARLVSLAAEGAREEAVLLAALVARADRALDVARVAAAVGHLLTRRRAGARPEG
jgi:hypothetical protein